MPVLLDKWLIGINNKSDPVALPKGAVVDAVDGVFTLAGNWVRRDGTAVTDTVKYHSLWSHPLLGAYGVVNNFLCQLHYDGNVISTAPIIAMTSGHPLSYTALNSSLVCTNRSQLLRIYHGLPIPLGGEVPAAPTLTAYDADTPTLDSFVNETGMAPMPPGDIVRYWRGRLFVARDNVLNFSQPMWYGVYDPTEDFIQLENDITFLEAVQDGLYIGDKNGVRFLKGTGPDDWELETSDDTPAQPGSGIMLPAYELDLDPPIPDPSVTVAVWLGKHGFVVGLPDGTVRSPQAKNIDVAIATSGATYFLNGYLVSFRQ